jgi:hypothetical protein
MILPSEQRGGQLRESGETVNLRIGLLQRGFLIFRRTPPAEKVHEWNRQTKRRARVAQRMKTHWDEFPLGIG